MRARSGRRSGLSSTTAASGWPAAFRRVADSTYQGPHSRLAKLPPRRRGWCLVVVIDASTLMPTDATMHDQDDTGLLTQLGPVAILAGDTSRPTPDL